MTSPRTFRIDPIFPPPSFTDEWNLSICTMNSYHCSVNQLMAKLYTQVLCVVLNNWTYIICMYIAPPFSMVWVCVLATLFSPDTLSSQFTQGNWHSLPKPTLLHACIVRTELLPACQYSLDPIQHTVAAWDNHQAKPCIIRFTQVRPNTGNVGGSQLSAVNDSHTTVDNFPYVSGHANSNIIKR